MTISTEPLLEAVTLGYGNLFDAKHTPMAARLTVHPLAGAQTPNVAELLGALAQHWPAEAGPLWLNLTNVAWLSELMQASPSPHLFVELPAFLAGDPGWAAPCIALAAQGVPLVLKGRPLAPLSREVLAAFRYAIVDRSEDRRMSPQPGQPPARWLPFVQSGATSKEDAADSFKRGALAVLDWPLGDPPDGSPGSKPVPAGVRVVMDLMQRVERGEPVAKLEASLRGDPTLAFRLMRFINSPGFGLSVEVSSFQHAIMLLGYQRLKRWLALLMTSAVDDALLKPLMFMAVRRGLLMEALAKSQGDSTTQSEVFICGVFSLLDRMLRQPFSRLMDSLPVPERVAQALCHGEGPYAPYLELACAVEMASPIDIRDATERMMITPGEVNRAVLQAMSMAKQTHID